MIDLSLLKYEDIALLEFAGKELGWHSFKVIRAKVDLNNDWRVFMVEYSKKIDQMDLLGKKINDFDSNRYVTIEKKPKFMGSHVTYHQASHHLDGRRKAEESYDLVISNINKYNTIGHL